MELRAAKNSALMSAMYILLRHHLGSNLYPGVLIQHLHRCTRCFEEACGWAKSIGAHPCRMASAGWTFCALTEYWIYLSQHAPPGVTESELLSLIERLCHHFSFGPHSSTHELCQSKLCPMQRERPENSVAASTTGPDPATPEIETHTTSPLPVAKAHSHFLSLHDRLVSQGLSNSMPIHELPADIYRIVVKHCIVDGPHKLHDLMRRRDISSFLKSSEIAYNTGVPILRQMGLLEIDLTESICFLLHEDGTQVSYDNHADGKIQSLAKSIRTLDCLARYSTIMLKIPPLLTFPEQELDGDRWEKAHLNLEALRSAWRGYDTSKDTQMKISAEIHVSNIVGKIPNLARYMYTGERPIELTATEVVMCTHRDHYGQMDELEARHYNWVEPPEDLTAPSQAFHFAFNKPTSVELAHKLGVLTKLGDYFRKRGKKVLVRETLEATDGLEWTIPARPQCPQKEDCEYHAGADVKSLYMIADRMSPKSRGLWLCVDSFSG